MQTFRKQNLNFLEILFTEYYYVEEKSIPLWKRLKEKREEITHFDYVRSFKSFKGNNGEKIAGKASMQFTRTPGNVKVTMDPHESKEIVVLDCGEADVQGGREDKCFA